MEHVRKITDLHRVPDLLLLADDDVFPRYLTPTHVTWWADFAHNRMVVAFTSKSRGHDSISVANWFTVLTRPDVQVGRADPTLAPVGYRTLRLFALSEIVYRVPGLANALAANAPERNMRPNAAELAALLAAGELDYIYDYESVARAQKFEYIVMPEQITGTPVTYALSIPIQAPHPATAARLLRDLLSPPGRAELRARFIDMLDPPVVHGTGAPAFLTSTKR